MVPPWISARCVTRTRPLPSSTSSCLTASVCGIRRELEQAKECLTELRFRLASDVYAGKPPGSRQVVHPGTGERLA